MALAHEFAALLTAVRGGEEGICVYPVRNGGVQIEWEDGTHDHEMELCPDGAIEFLHMNRATKEMVTGRSCAA